MTPGIRSSFLLALVLFAGTLHAEKTAAVDASALHRRGLQAMAEGRWGEALDVLEAATAAAPNDILIGADYRQAVIGAATAAKTIAPYDRCLAFFEKLVAQHPRAANAHLNHGFAHVDKVPAEGAITQVILANRALEHFGKALAIEESWLGYYSRGHAYLYWPPIFGRTGAGIADLERAVAIGRAKGDRQAYYGHAWAALGDGYWRKDDVARAREIWKEGLALHPSSAEIQARASLTEREALDAYLEKHYDVTARVGTHLHEIYPDRRAEVSSK
jgi:tetratricopeptide (TPR) repeat protein